MLVAVQWMKTLSNNLEQKLKCTKNGSQILYWKKPVLNKIVWNSWSNNYGTWNIFKSWESLKSCETLSKANKMPKKTKKLLRLHGFLQQNCHKSPSKEPSCIEKDLARTCETALKRVKFGCHFVNVSNAGYFTARLYQCGPSNQNEKLVSNNCIWFTFFPPNQLNVFVYGKELLSVQFALEAFEHYVCELNDKQIIVLTKNKSVTQLL